MDSVRNRRKSIGKCQEPSDAYRKKWGKLRKPSETVEIKSNWGDDNKTTNNIPAKHPNSGIMKTLLVDQLLVDQLLVDQLLVDQLLVDQQLVDQLLVQSMDTPWIVHSRATVHGQYMD